MTARDPRAEGRLFSTAPRVIEWLDALDKIATFLKPVGHFSVEKRSAYMRVTGHIKSR